MKEGGEEEREIVGDDEMRNQIPDQILWTSIKFSPNPKEIF